MLCKHNEDFDQRLVPEVLASSLNQKIYSVYKES